MIRISKKVRRLIRVLHRDIGYYLTALVCAYSISGIAVNHIDDWNPNYSISQREVAIGALSGDLDTMQRQVVERLDLDTELVRGRHLVARDALVVFLIEGGEVRVNPATGAGSIKDVRPRPLLREFNVLHLNHIKGAWTWFADAVGVMLLLLALTGLFMLKGTLGLAGRGKWFVIAGILTPAAFLWAHYASQ